MEDVIDSRSVETSRPLVASNEGRLEASVEFPGFLSSHPISVILFLLGLVIVLSRGFFAARAECNESDSEVRKRVLQKDEDVKASARLAES